MRSGMWNAVAAVVLPVAVVTASCDREPAEETKALSEEVQRLGSRLDALERRDLASEVDELKSRLGRAAGVSDAKAREIAARAAREAATRAVDHLGADLRGEIERKLRAGKGAGKVVDVDAGRAKVDRADAKKGKAAADGAGGQEAALEKRARAKAEQIGKKAGFPEDRVRALTGILLDREKAYAEIKRRIRAKELSKEDARDGMREAKEDYEAAVGRFLDTLQGDERAAAEKVLRPQKRAKKPKDARPAGGAAGKGERKKKGNKDQGDPIEF